MPLQRNNQYLLQIKTNSLLIAVFAFFFITEMIGWLSCKHVGLSDWAYNEWLIDYSGGFTRRGLQGELINILSSFATPATIIGFISWFILIAVVGGFLRLCTRSVSILQPEDLFGILFLPCLFPFYLYDNAALGRKEIIGFLILLWHLYLLERCAKNHARIFHDNQPLLPKNDNRFPKTYLKNILLLTLILLPVQLLIHEGTVFLFLPIHIILTYSILRCNSTLRFTKRLTCVGLLYLPVILAFFIICMCGRPSFETALTLTKKWELCNALPGGSSSIAGKNPMWALPDGITALPWTISQTISVTCHFISAKALLYWAVILPIMGYSTVFFVRRISMSVMKSCLNMVPSQIQSKYYLNRIVFMYLILPLICSLPLYIVGCDYGRYFAVVCINFTMLGLSGNVHYTELCNSRFLKIDYPHPIKAEENEAYNCLFMLKMCLFLFIIFFIRLHHMFIGLIYSFFSHTLSSLIKKVFEL
jgi:hypothetical protein